MLLKPSLAVPDIGSASPGGHEGFQSGQKDSKGKTVKSGQQVIQQIGHVSRLPREDLMVGY